MTRGSRLTAFALATLTATSVAACSGGNTLDLNGVQDIISSDLGFEVGVECPSGVPRQEGLVTECTMTSEGISGPVFITQYDDEGSIDWDMNAPAGTE